MNRRQFLIASSVICASITVPISALANSQYKQQPHKQKPQKLPQGLVEADGWIMNSQDKLLLSRKKLVMPR